MEKKQKQTKSLPKREVPNPKLLVSIPATLTNHMQHREKVVDAIKAALGEDPFTFDLSEPNSLGWDFVVDAYNKVANRVVTEGFDYVLIVESDVVIPENALSHLLEQNVDVAVAVVPFHSYPKNPALNTQKTPVDYEPETQPLPYITIGGKEPEEPRSIFHTKKFLAIAVPIGFLIAAYISYILFF